MDAISELRRLVPALVAQLEQCGLAACVGHGEIDFTFRIADGVIVFAQPDVKLSIKRQSNIA